jgi:UDP-GlcNAc:undecaprenyl-phosphate GlcNAc-1-phosphate transferase
LVPRLQKSFFAQPAFYAALAGGATLTFAVGVWDDLRGAGIWSRLVLETIAAGVVIFGGGVLIDRLAVPFVGKVPLGELAVPLTFLWIVGVTNALNIIDGLDGLAGGIAFIACFGVFAVALLNGDAMAMAAMALLAGACLGFLRYNSHPARIFLGDSGALLLGFLLATVSIETSMKRSTGLALIIPMQMLAVPLLDTLYSMGRRLADEIMKADDFSLSSLRSMFRSDSEHIHHILLDVGFSHPKAVWVLYLLSTVIAGFGLLSAISLNDRISLLFLLAGVAGFLIVRHFGASLPFIRRWKRVTDKHEPVEPVMADGGEKQESEERDSSEQRPVEPAE